MNDIILRNGYWYILKNQKGNLSELDKINTDLADYLENSGIITISINSEAELRYRITEDGKRRANIDYTSLTLKLFRERNNIKN